MHGERIKQLRLAHGWSLDALAVAMDHAVTKQALSKYESGTANPSSTVLCKLAAALGVKAAHLLQTPPIAVKIIACRKKRSLGKKEQERIENLISVDLERRVRLQTIMQAKYHEGSRFSVNTPDAAERAAASLRNDWNLGGEPIGNLTAALEDRCIHVVPMVTSDKFDGISAIVTQEGQEIAAGVVSRTGVPGERQRLNLAHELGHIFMDVQKGMDEENAAFRFAGAFLVPKEALITNLGETRTKIELNELMFLKQRYGISMQALLYRAKDLGIISPSYFKNCFFLLSTKGWRKDEPHPIKPEEPTWLKRTALRAYAEKLITREEAEVLTDTHIKGEVSRVAKVLAMSKEERRSLVQRQAEQAAADYASDQAALQEVGNDDVTEY